MLYIKCIGDNMNLSVTGILHNYKTFSRDFWLQYKALEAVMDPFLFDNIKLKLQKSKRIDPKYLENIDIAEFEQKKFEIDADWRQKSEEAKAVGTSVHEMIHNMLCTDLQGCRKYGIPTDQYKVEANENFLNSNGLFPEFRMEVKLDEDYTLIGIADLIIKEGNKVKIVDFKTADKIEMKSRYELSKKKKSSFKYPISNIEDCNYNEYTLQLSIYAWLLRNLFPTLEVTSLEIYHIQDLKLKKIYPVTEMKEEVEKLIPYHLKSVKLKRECDKCREITY